ncbi:MAG: glutamate--tRNA ligase family protein, partial [Gammaproteobacteria bacterium]|nr:glutamate--tRNA ligase family protein [Gammaproteobacteria bacterium]
MPDQKPHYRGRFAPSPTGPLHIGSLIAAVASYLEAQCHQGEWLIRMEDVDETRNIKHADTDILNTLEAYGFEWQGEVIYQTQRKQAYQHALEQLQAQDLIYRCVCSRSQIKEQAEHGP